MEVTTADLVLFGGERVLIDPDETLFNWPILTAEDEEAVLAIMRKPNFADEETVARFEEEFAAWIKVPFAIAHNCGTTALQAAMWAAGVRRGSEVIAPSSTYWATILQCFSLGATPVFADIDPDTLCISADDIERKISPYTKAIVVVHLLGYPADMDRINAIAKKHGVKVIEDASHAHGTLYKGRKAGDLGDVAVFSCCGKGLAIGEGGMLVTRDRDVYEGVLAWCHNFSFNSERVGNAELLRFKGLPLGGVTARMHNLSAAIGRVQLRHLDARMAVIDQAMNYFWDLLEGLPGIHAHRPSKESGHRMGCWYCPHGIYRPEELGGLSVSRFIEGVRAEGYHSWTRSCIKEPLHLHPLLNHCDIYGDGQPTRLAQASRKFEQGSGSLPITESVKSFTVPWFKQLDKNAIEKYAALFRKVVENHEELLAGDQGDEAVEVDERGNG
jgi:perosamine synthetase